MAGKIKIDLFLRWVQVLQSFENHRLSHLPGGKPAFSFKLWNVHSGKFWLKLFYRKYLCVCILFHQQNFLDWYGTILPTLCLAAVSHLLLPKHPDRMAGTTQNLSQSVKQICSKLTPFAFKHCALPFKNLRLCLMFPSYSKPSILLPLKKQKKKTCLLFSFKQRQNSAKVEYF